MAEQTDVVLAKLEIQLENLISVIASLRTEIDLVRKSIADNRAEADSTQRSLIELQGRLRGGAMVLTFFQALMFGAFFWLFSQVSAHGTAIAELKNTQQHLSTQIDRNIQQLSQQGHK